MTDTTSLRELIRSTLIQCHMDHPDYRLTTTLIDDMAAAVATALAARAEPQAGAVALLEEYGRGYDAGFEIGDRLANADLDAMVDRFLAWKLPADFHPDAGITFTLNPTFQSPGNPNWPVGTNLLSAVQARAMFEHCAAPSPASRARPGAQGEWDGDDQSWDREAERITAAALGVGEINPNATSVDDIFIHPEPPVITPPADRAPGEVDDAMVRRASLAYEVEMEGNVYGPEAPEAAMRAALKAALTHQEPAR